jgi:ABC-type transport system involved in multi-copper enzyme maturation permease subunit
VIARLTLRESSRRRIVLTALVLGVLFLLIFSIGFHLILSSPVNPGAGEATARLIRAEQNNGLLLAGLYAVSFLSVAMAALMAADTLAGEITTGTIQTVVSKPIRRADVVLGKWLGFAALLGMYQALMSGGVALSVYLQSGYHPPHLLAGIGVIYLESLLVMSVALMCSSRLSALATGAVVFGMWGLAFIGGWVEQIGTALQSDTAGKVGIITSLIIPSEALWRRAAYEKQSPLSGLIDFSPFGSLSTPSLAMVIYAGVYLLGMLLLALRIFNRRDL